MKRTFALMLALILLCGCLLLPVHAESSVGAVKLRLRSDVAGYACSDYSRFMEIVSGNVIYNTRSAGPVYASDYGGTSDHGKLVAGRTYYVSYVVQAADGYALPDKIDDVDLSFDCGKGVSVITSQIVVADVRTDDGTFVRYKGLRVYAKLVVDGNIFQRIAGYFTDLYLKIRAWSLY